MTGMVAMKRKHKKSTSKKPTRTAMAHSLTKTQKAEVTALVKGREQTKMTVQQVIDPGTYFSQGITSAGELYSLLPKMYEGVEEGTMSGARIMPISLTVDFAVGLYYAVSNSFDITAHLYCLTNNNIKSYNQIGSVTTNFLRDPTVASPGAVTGFTGGLQNSLLPVDTRAFKILAHKKIRLRKGTGTSNEGGSGTGVVTPGTPIKYFRVKVKLPKVLKYEQTTSNTIEDYPTNFNPFWCLGWVYNDDSAVDNHTPVFVQAVATLKYKNA
nr:MAG: capsid protein [Cressdnaviricota sp.]